MLDNKLDSQINFLKKYLPTTPDKKYMRSLSPFDNIRFTPRSPCPSPTPIFQQLYHALSHWERIMSESPEQFQEKFRLLDEKLKLETERYGRFGSLDEPDETDDEGSQNDDNDENKSDNTLIKRSNSYLDLSGINEKSSSGHSLGVAGASLKERRKSSPADLIDAKSGGQLFVKSREPMRNNLVEIKIYDDTS